MTFLSAALAHDWPTVQGHRMDKALLAGTRLAQPLALSSYRVRAKGCAIGHLMPGNEDEAADLLDTYLDRAGQARASGGQ
jgi:hypothetical protein